MKPTRAKAASTPPLTPPSESPAQPAPEIAILLATVDSFRAIIIEQQIRLATLEAAKSAPPVIVNWVPLKKACGDRALRYATGLKWAALGYITTKRVGARWLVDTASLDIAITTRL
jgi:hypothetical protein